MAPQDGAYGRAPNLDLRPASPALTRLCRVRFPFHLVGGIGGLTTIGETKFPPPGGPGIIVAGQCAGGRDGFAAPC